MILRHRLHCTVLRSSGVGEQPESCQWKDGHSAQGKVCGWGVHMCAHIVVVVRVHVRHVCVLCVLAGQGAQAQRVRKYKCVWECMHSCARVHASAACIICLCVCVHVCACGASARMLCAKVSCVRCLHVQ